MTGLTYRYNAKSHVGRKRKVNEDAVLALPELGIWMISDGMGGHAAGDFASQVIADTFAMIDPALAPVERMRAVRQAIHDAHRVIVSEAERRGGGTIGATVVAFMVEQAFFTAFWAGDSRLYRLRGGEITLLTADHSVVAELVETGQLTWDEADQHPESNRITRAVGVGDDVEVDKVRGTVQAGDRFLLCSDGLTKYAGFEVLRRNIDGAPLETVVDRLIQIALDGGGADNISVIVIDAG